MSEEKDAQITWTEDGAVLVSVNVKEHAAFELHICGTDVKWDEDQKTLYINDKLVQLSNGLEDMTIVIDREMLEVGLNQDTVSYFKEVPVTENKCFEARGNLEIKLGIVK